MSTGITSYKDLIVWRPAVDLAVACYAETKNFPSSEAYGMVSQIRRSSVSIAANIAEGHGRDNTGSFVQFLRMAQGSLKELETHLIIAERVGLTTEAQAQGLLRQTVEIGKMLRALIRNPPAKALTMTTRYSLLAIRYSLLPIPHFLLAIRCSFLGGAA